MNGLVNGLLTSGTGRYETKSDNIFCRDAGVGKLHFGQVNDGGAYPRAVGGDADVQGWLLEFL